MSTIEQENARRSREIQERSREVRESKEGEVDEELKAAATMERADYLVHEVKSSKTQIQNIVIHMQQVVAAIKALREQLALSTAHPDEASVVQDKKRVQDLQQKISGYKDELLKMKDDLIREQMVVLRASDPQLDETNARQQAETAIAQLLKGAD